MTPSLETRRPVGSLQPEPLVDPAAIERACASIAPTWPLDRFIAVNPLWEMTDRPFPEVAAQLAARSGATMLMPRRWFREQFAQGVFTEAHVRRALEASHLDLPVQRVLALLEADEPLTTRRARVLDLADAEREGRVPSWRSFVTSNLSQFCASYFDEGQALFRPAAGDGLYATWRQHALDDQTPRLVMGLALFTEGVRLLPSRADELIELAMSELYVPRADQEAYASSLLLDLNGWASWAAYRRWTARLAGRDDATVKDVLALQLAWEWLVFQAGGPTRLAAWQRAMARWPECDARSREAHRDDWVLQRALELAWQDRVAEGLRSGASASTATATAQAVFCIDVRSEPFRRALEAEGKGVQTLGFAGFFGLPVDYQPLGATSATPQLPGLLAPALRMTDTGVSDTVARDRSERLSRLGALDIFKGAASSAFSFVESTGASYAWSLVAETLGLADDDSSNAGLSAKTNAQRKPRVTSTVDGAPVTTERKVQLAAGILRGMSLTRRFARLVVLFGHGGHSRNNAHAAGLDCGACCGQTGEANARAAAALLNEVEVRAGLRTLGLEVPDETVFLAGLHHTTTDEVSLFELDELPASHRADVDALTAALQRAGHRTRLERAPKLGVAETDEQRLLQAVRKRSSDWAQVRPEWALADNAGFIVGPRTLSASLRLEGRSFLHEYVAAEDEGFKVLEGILTAPMVVTHWINLQYYASTVDNLRYGSGNKVLHNVVGGHVGVFEGNGGDLRIGLSKQSLHDGKKWVHTPQRLSVFVAAPRDAIDAILAKHAKVRALVENEWLFLLQVDETSREVQVRSAAGWARLPQ
jgi:uncharacterized protein YbcC (UPF0753/DUF2309 family)